MKTKVLTLFLLAVLTIPLQPLRATVFYDWAQFSQLSVGDILMDGAALKYVSSYWTITIDGETLPLSVDYFFNLDTSDASHPRMRCTLRSYPDIEKYVDGCAIRVKAIDRNNGQWDSPVDWMVTLEGIDNEETISLDNSTGSYLWYGYYTDKPFRRITLGDRTLYRDGRWQTICLPFAQSAKQLKSSPLAGADIRAFTGASLTDGTLTLTFDPVEHMEAGVPYLVRWIDGGADIANPQFDYVFFEKSSPESVSRGVAELMGVFRPVTLTAGNQNQLYLGGDNRLYYPTGDVTVYAFRAYLLLKESGGSPLLGVHLFFGNGEGTAVSLPPATSQQRTGTAVYSLDGVLQNAGGKGIRIVNGKKIMMK